jgi:hypothetical protein
MHQKRSQSIVRAELSTFGEPLVGLGLIDVHGHMATDCPKQIMIFEIKIRNDAGFLQYNEPVQTLAQEQGHYQPPTAIALQPTIELQVLVSIGMPLHLLEINDPLSIFQEPHES